MQNLIDTHFHLDYYKNHRELYSQINNLKQYTICMTASPGIYYSCKHLYHETQYLKFALGFHPQEMKLNDNDFKDFKKLFKDAKYIGEVGLDFSPRYYKNKNEQLNYFDEIIRMCEKENKLVSVHLRNAYGSGIGIIKKYKPSKCIIHWYSGNEEELHDLIKLGCYFSLNENMIRNQDKSLMLLKIPIEKILVESDGPFSKIGSQKFKPELLINEYESIARFFDEPDLIKIIYNNFLKLLL